MAKVRPASNRLKEQENFTRVPNEVIEEDDLSPQAKMVWIEFWKFAYSGGGVFPGMERIANDLNYSKKTARKYRKELEEAELLKTERRGQGRTNIYYLYVPDVDLEREMGSSQDTRMGSHEEDEDNKTKSTTQVYDTEYLKEDLNLDYDDPDKFTPRDLVKIVNYHLAENGYPRRTTSWGKDVGVVSNVRGALDGGSAKTARFLKWVADEKVQKLVDVKGLNLNSLGFLNNYVTEFEQWITEKEDEERQKENIDAGAPDPVEGVESMDEVRSIMEG